MAVKVTVETRVPDMRRRYAAIIDTRNIVGEVFVQGARNVRLWRYHTSSEPRSKIPWRDPGFLTSAEVASIRAHIREGVNQIIRGTVASLMPALRFATNLARNAVKQHFGQHGAGQAVAAGVPAAPLSPAYAKRKQEQFGKHPILVATGELRKAIRSRVTRGGAGGGAGEAGGDAG